MSNGKNAPKRSVGKVLAKILLWLVIVLVAVGLLALWQIERIAATGTRTIGTMLTGTKVDVKDISISPLAGKVVVKNLTVANPEGFHNPTAIKVEKIHIDAGMSSLLSDKVVIEHLEITGVAVDYEVKLDTSSNLSVILKNVEKATGADKQKTAQSGSSQGKKSAAQKQVVIKKLIMNNNKVTASSSLTKTTIPLYLAPVEMENVGEGKDLFGTVAEVTTRFFTEIFNSAAKAFSKLGKSLSETGEDIINNLDKATDSVSNTVVSAGDSAGQALDDTLNSTKKLLRGIPGLGK